MFAPSQFRVLYRRFLTQILDRDVLAPGGDVSDAVARFAALLASVSFLMAVLIVPRYFTTNLTPAGLMYSRWNDEEFLLSATIAVAGLTAVLAWNAFLPEKKDCLVLGSLPISLPTMAAAKTAATLTALAVGVTAINAFTGLGFPIAIAGRGRFLPIAALGWWVATAAAALFVFCAVMALQGIVSLLLPWQAYLRISGLLQLMALAVVLAWFFGSPPFALTVLNGSPKSAFLPSYWFTGLLNVLMGRGTPALDRLAAIAARNVVIAGTVAIVTTALAWRRNPRRIMETPEITPSKRRFALPAIARVCCPGAFERVIFLFTARTVARSRQHRLLLAVYGGAGLAVAITFLTSFFEGRDRARWNLPNIPFLAVGWLLLFAAIAGMRAIFVLPRDTAANWVFRVTQVRGARLYCAAVRKSLMLMGAVPLWIAAACFYLSVWPGSAGAGAVLLLAPAGLIVVYGSMKEFQKVPFTCAWMPEGAQSRMKMAVWALVLTVFAGTVSGIELWGLSRLARFVVLALILVAVAVRERARCIESAEGSLDFDGGAGNALQTLDLDGDRKPPPEDAPLAPRHYLRSWHFAVLLLVAGLVYEQAGRARESAEYPPIGHAYDIGGRSLNLACAGEGSPAVIFEADWGQAGYVWSHIQRDAARLTKACWYDRAGYGWSDPGPFPQHSDRIARDLHQLLKAARVDPPYVLVAAGMGAFHSRVFRGNYESEVAGLVLVDPMNEDMTINIHNHIEFFRPAVVQAFRTIGMVGGWRLFDDEPVSSPRAFSLSEWKMIVALNQRSVSNGTQTREPPLWVNGEMARSSGKPGSLPLIVLSSNQRGPVADEQLEDRELTLRLNRRLAELSKNGVWIGVESHQNRMLLEAPEEISAAIARVLKYVRGGS